MIKLKKFYWKNIRNLIRYTGTGVVFFNWFEINEIIKTDENSTQVKTTYIKYNDILELIKHKIDIPEGKVSVSIEESWWGHKIIGFEYLTLTITNKKWKLVSPIQRIEE